MMLWSIAAAWALPDIDSPHRAGAPASADAAVVIGNEAYAYLSEVPYAERDASAVYQALLYTVGIPGDRIHDLRAANREQMLAAVRQAATSLQGDGRLWLYFAGHGIASPSTGEPMLVGDDAKRDAAAFDARSVAVSELRREAGDVELIVVLDTCFAGVGRAGDELVSGARFAVPTWAPAETGAHVWTAAAPDQISVPYEPARHGLFTYFFVGALRGWADGELSGTPDGRVTADEASAYVRRALATLQVRTQQPRLDSPDPTSVLLVLGATLEAGPDLASLPRPGAAAEPSPTPPTPPPVGGGPTLPIERLASGLYADAGGQPVRWSDVRGLAREDAAGALAVRRLDSNLVGQAAALALVAGGIGAGVTGFLAQAGNCQESGFNCWYKYVGYAGIATSAGALAWEVRLATRRSRHRDSILEAANATR